MREAQAHVTAMAIQWASCPGCHILELATVSNTDLLQAILSFRTHEVRKNAAAAGIKEKELSHQW